LCNLCKKVTHALFRLFYYLFFWHNNTMKKYVYKKSHASHGTTYKTLHGSLKKYYVYKNLNCESLACSIYFIFYMLQWTLVQKSVIYGSQGFLSKLIILTFKVFIYWIFCDRIEVIYSSCLCLWKSLKIHRLSAK